MKGKFITLSILAIMIFSTLVMATNTFIIQNRAGTEFLLLDNETGNFNITTGWIAEGGESLTEKYWEITDTLVGDVTGTLGATTVVNTQGLSGENITAGIVADTYIASTIARDSEVVTANTSVKDYADAMDSAQDECSEITGCIENAYDSYLNFTGILTDTKVCIWDSTGSTINCTSDTGWTALTDMALTDTYMYVGNGANNPVGVDITGGISITNTGVVTVVDDSHLHDLGNLTGLPTCGVAEHLDSDGTDITCTADAGDSLGDIFVNETGDTMTGSLTMGGANIILNSGSNITTDNIVRIVI